MKQKEKNTILFVAIFLLAVLLRTVGFVAHPGGLNQDEASIGYDAWSILKYGVDRNGSVLPVHLIAWGSGQNALYAYLSMPFIALFSLNVFSVRIVSLLFGLASVAVVYFTVKLIFGRRTAFIAMALTAVSPWHIMLSRWGLESNIFPAFLLFGFYLLLLSLKKQHFLPFAAGVFAISLYSYGAAYLVVSLFCAGAAFFLLKEKVCSVKCVILSAIVFVLLAVPIGLFVITNLFKLGDISILGFTIPQMTGVSRITVITGFMPPLTALRNFFEEVILQYDGTYWNSLPFYGCIYTLSLPFAVGGIVLTFRNKSTESRLLLLLFCCCMLLFFVYRGTTINRVNCIYIPLILFVSCGINFVVRGKTSAVCVVAAYAVMVSGFCVKYFGSGYKSIIKKEFAYSFSEALSCADMLAQGETVYVTRDMNMPYIYILFYEKTDPHEYYESVEIENKNVQFQSVRSFKGYSFGVDGAASGLPGVYILTNNEAAELYSYSEKYSFENYTVAVIK